MLLIGLLLAVGGILPAEDKPFPIHIERLLKASAIKITFHSSSLSVMTNQKPAVTVCQQKPDMSPITFAQLDAKKSRAVMVGNAGSAEVLFWVSKTGLHFLEETDGGNPILTTIFFNQHNQEYVAVHSRHLGIPPFPGVGYLEKATPMPSQHYGTCTILDIEEVIEKSK